MIGIFIASGVLLTTGLFLFLCDLLGAPSWKQSKTLHAVLKEQPTTATRVSASLERLTTRLADKITLPTVYADKLQKTLSLCDISTPPKAYLMQLVVECLFLSFVACIGALVFKPVIAFAVIGPLLVYFNEVKRLEKLAKVRKAAIESELCSFVSTLVAELPSNHDILQIIKGYIPTSGPVLRKELQITVTDMESGTYEIALQRLATRINSVQVNNVVRGLIDSVRGNEVGTYFKMLLFDLKQISLKNTRIAAQGCVEKLTVCYIVLAIDIVLLLGVPLLLDLASKNIAF